MPREHPLAPHRLIPVAVIALLAVVAFLALRGPIWFQRLYHPLHYESAISEGARRSGLDPYLVAAVINVESGFDANDISEAGAVGLMQVMPSTALEVARENRIRSADITDRLKEPDTNIRIGTLHLADLRQRLGSPEQALAAYNAGEGNVSKWLRGSKTRTGRAFVESIPFPETKQYVAHVLAERDEYEKLYPDAFGKGGK